MSTTIASKNPPISKLPAEIVVRIFEHLELSCDHVDDWYRVTHVCRQWRRLAIDTAWLWTQIPTRAELDNPEWTRTILERSKAKPVKVSLVETPWKTNLAVYRHISHVGYLHIQRLGAEALEDMVYTLSVMRDEPKALKMLRIWGDEDEIFELPSTCFRGADLLWFLDLGWIDIDWHTTPLLGQGLTHLTLESMRGQSAPSWSQLLAALSRMSNLRVLTLEHIFPMSPAANGNSSQMDKIHLPHLEDLAIRTDFAFQIQSFLPYLTFPPLRYAWIGCDSNDPGHDDYSTALQPLAHSFPPTSYGEFSSLFISLKRYLKSGSDVFHSAITCRPSSVNTEFEGRVDFTLSATAQVPPERIISDTLVHLNLSHTLTYLHIRHFDVPEEFPLDAPFKRLFGELPNLGHIVAGGEHALSLIRGLDIPLDHPFGTPLPFPALSRVELAGLDMKRNKDRCDELEDVLMARYEYGAEIQTLRLTDTYHISGAVAQRFADIVVDFDWTLDFLSKIHLLHSNRTEDAQIS